MTPAPIPRPVRCLLALAIVLSIGAPAFGQSSAPATSSQPPQTTTAPAVSKPIDPSLFDPQNQKECDYPGPCGCNCVDTTRAKAAPTK